MYQNKINEKHDKTKVTLIQNTIKPNQSDTI